MRIHVLAARAFVLSVVAAEAVQAGRVQAGRGQFCLAGWLNSSARRTDHVDQIDHR